MRIFVSAYVIAFFTLNIQAQTLPPPGKLIEVNGYNLHLISEGSGGPTVVLFHGAGDIALIWNLVLPELGEHTRAVAVDQAGEGWSDHGHAIHMWQQAYDTHTALQKAGIPGPYILVGHSLGGLLTRVYTKLYPDEVVGIVLVDATHPDVVLKIYEDGQPSWKRMRQTSRGRAIPAIDRSRLAQKPELSSFQPRRDFGDQLAKFSESDKKRFDWFYNQRPFSYVKGRSSFEAETMQLIHENSPEYSFGERPLTVLSKGVWTPKEGDSNWNNEALRKESVRLQKDLLKLSKNSRQVIAHGSGHQIHIDDPALVVAVIVEMIESLRENR